MNQGVEQWLINALQKLPCVRRKTFDVSPLPLCVQSVQSERSLSAAANPAYDRQFADRKINVHVFQIVLPTATQRNTGDGLSLTLSLAGGNHFSFSPLSNALVVPRKSGIMPFPKIGDYWSKCHPATKS